MKDFVVKDSGKRQKFDTGAVRDIQVGKGRFDLLPPKAIERMAKHYESGAVKYDDNNYLKGMPISRFLDSCLRHINKYRCGESDEDHLIAAAWNLFAIVETEELIKRKKLPKNLNDGKFYNKISIMLKNNKKGKVKDGNN